MPAAYDKFDYPAYWIGREYEHESEVIALTGFLYRIKRIKRLLDAGAGYGRLTPYYIHRSRRVVLVDPSSKLLKLARKNLLAEQNAMWRRKLIFYQSKIENVPKILRNKSFDLVIMIRVIHHLESPEKAISIIDKLLVSGGYVILEFPNKLHWKALVGEFIRGNLLYPLDIYPNDKRSAANISSKELPFLNFHPDIMKEAFANKRYDIIEVRSVSNVRSPRLKRSVPLPVLLFLERHLQRPLSKISFGPSIFILARKK